MTSVLSWSDLFSTLYSLAETDLRVIWSTPLTILPVWMLCWSWRFLATTLALQVDAVGKQAGLAGRHVVEPGVARVAAFVEHRYRALSRCFLSSVVFLTRAPLSGYLAEDALVVDGEFFDLDGVVDDGDHRGGLARQADVGDGVLEEFADLGGVAERGDALGGVERHASPAAAAVAAA